MRKFLSWEIYEVIPRDVFNINEVSKGGRNHTIEVMVSPYHA